MMDSRIRKTPELSIEERYRRFLEEHDLEMPMTAKKISESVSDEVEDIVNGFLPVGLTLLCGAPKCGKSRLALQICRAIAYGDEIMGMRARKGEALYLALEDNPQSMRRRMLEMETNECEAIRVVFRVTRNEDELLEFLKLHVQCTPGLKLVIIDTLQHVAKKDITTSYGGENFDLLKKLKQLATENGIGILCLHHTTKRRDKRDPFNDMLGSVGLRGTADNCILIERENQRGNLAHFYVEGRGTAKQEFVASLEGGKCWEIRERISEEQAQEETIPEVVDRAARYIARVGAWEGSASDLIEEAKLGKINPALLSRYMSTYSDYLESRGLKRDQSIHRGNTRRLMRFVVEDERICCNN